MINDQWSSHTAGDTEAPALALDLSTLAYIQCSSKHSCFTTRPSDMNNMTALLVEKLPGCDWQG